MVRIEFTAVGKVVVEITLTDHGGNLTSWSKEYNVGKGTGYGSVTINGWTYGQAPNSPTPTSSTNGTSNVTYNYTGTTNARVSYNSSTAPTEAGSYTVTATFAETANYNSCTATKTFTISRATMSPSPTVNMSDYTYGGTPSTPSVSGNLGNGTVTYWYNTTDSAVGQKEWTNIGSTTLSPGTYYMMADIKGMANYYNIWPTVSFTVNALTAAEVEYTPANSSWKVKNVQDALDDLYLNSQCSVVYTNSSSVTLNTNGSGVPSVDVTSLSLSTNANYVLSFDYVIDSGTNTFDFDLYPDDLPQGYATATTTVQHMNWKFSSSSSNMSSCKLRFFDDLDYANDSGTITISNITLYKVP